MKKPAIAPINTPFLVNGLISLAETMHANGLDNSADILYIEVINLMETTLLKDYLIVMWLIIIKKIIKTSRTK